MHSHLPIGVFDSGLGGLTIVRAIRHLLPQEGIIYFGDTAHLPYGDKSPELIQSYCKSITEFLIKQPVKAIVIACNTASALALDVVKEIAQAIPVFDVIYPATIYSLSVSKSGNIGIIGTKATIRSGIYGKLLHLHTQKEVHVVEKATPLLVPMIEEGWLNNRVSQDVIDAYMSDTAFEQIDTLILGCTHYPLIKKQIETYFSNNHPKGITVVDSSVAVAQYVKSALSQSQLLNNQQEKPYLRFFLSDYSQNFQDAAKLFLAEDVHFEKVEGGVFQ